MKKLKREEKFSKPLFYLKRIISIWYYSSQFKLSFWTIFNFPCNTISNLVIVSNIDSTDLFRVIGKNVKYYRKLYNLKNGKMTQENLAEIVDVSTALIGNLESDKIEQGVSVFTLWKISKALNVPIDKLFDDSDFNDRNLEA